MEAMVTGYAISCMVVTTDGQMTEGRVRVQAAVATVAENKVKTVNGLAKVKEKRICVMEEGMGMLFHQK
jgi:hypothetical protein